MARVLVVYASRHGSTVGIGERIADVLRASGHEVVAAKVADGLNPAGFDACVVGSGVYMGSWLKEGIDWLDRHQAALATRPVWLFSSGPLPGSTKETAGTDPVTNALGPTEGPGSGGRKQIEALSAVIHPRDHVVFQGAFDPDDPPKAMAERLVRLLPMARKVLPPGDFREWDAIETWAHDVAAEIRDARIPERGDAEVLAVNVE